MIDHFSEMWSIYSNFLYISRSWKFSFRQGLCVGTVVERGRPWTKQLLSSVFSFSSPAKRIQVKCSHLKWMNDPAELFPSRVSSLFLSSSPPTPPIFSLKPCIHALSLPLIGSRSEVCGALVQLYPSSPWGAFILPNWFWKSCFTDHRA